MNNFILSNMSVKEAVKRILKYGKKSQNDLADHMGERFQKISDNLRISKVTPEMIQALSEITNIDIEEVKRIIDEARKEELKASVGSSNVKELEDKLKNLRLTIDLLTDKLKHSESAIIDKNKTIEILQKTIADKDKIILEKDKIIEKKNELMKSITEEIKKI